MPEYVILVLAAKHLRLREHNTRNTFIIPSVYAD